MKAGDTIKVLTPGKEFVGILLPQEKKETLFLKLESGYNIGIAKATIKKIVLITKALSSQPSPLPVPNSVRSGLPLITIFHTGGTIASQVDYRTGAVVSRFTPDQLMSLVPQLSGIATITTKKIFQMFSEDMEPIHWGILAEEVAKELKHQPRGIIIGIGTDTLEYAASALSFSLQHLPVPVVLVGSQRSIDRPSSDAAMNILCAAHFITQTDFAGVAVCMHQSENDDACFIIEAHHVKKMHTSRRDTFRPINRMPLADVDARGTITYLRKDYATSSGSFELKNTFSSKVGLVKIYPGFRKEELTWYENNCKGLVIEGYAFGQMPINALDTHTAHHPALLKKIQRIAKKMPVVVVSQRPYGLTFMNVYSTGRDILGAGLIEAKTQVHVAYVKLCWVLGQTSVLAEAKKLMSTNINGEILDRIEVDTFLK